MNFSVPGFLLLEFLRSCCPAPLGRSAAPLARSCLLGCYLDGRSEQNCETGEWRWLMGEVEQWKRKRRDYASSEYSGDTRREATRAASLRTCSFLAGLRSQKRLSWAVIAEGGSKIFCGIGGPWPLLAPPWFRLWWDLQLLIHDACNSS
jgi:hypothetical protein